MPILMSIKPRFSRLIFSGEKKYELRKTPIKNKSDNMVIVYESAPTKAIVGSFTINGVVRKSPNELWRDLKQDIGISKIEFFTYFQQNQWGYAIEVGNPKLFKRRISLNELREHQNSWNPPQNFQYLKRNSEIEFIINKTSSPKDLISSISRNER